MTSRALVDGQLVDAPVYCAFRSWTDTPDVAALPRRDRGDRRPVQIVVHESVTSDRRATERILSGKGLGVHFMVEPTPNGHSAVVTQHGDPIRDRMAHAASQNGTSIAIEVVNPYYPERDRPGPPWELVIDSAGWAHAGKDGRRNYLVPPMMQLEAVAQLIGWATLPDGPIGIPRIWPGLDARRGRFAMGRLAGVGVRSPGIWAHTYTAHADGDLPVLYSWLRIEAQLSPAAAYAEAVRVATTRRRWADVQRWVNGSSSSTQPQGLV